MYKFSESSLKRLYQADETLRLVMLQAIKDSPYDFGISSTYRSPEEQNELYKKGRTEPGDIVTYLDGYERKSKHNYLPSLAVDIKCYSAGEITWEPSVFLEVGLHIMEIADKMFTEGKIKSRISWGGHWTKFKDYPHFQV